VRSHQLGQLAATDFYPKTVVSGPWLASPSALSDLSDLRLSREQARTCTGAAAHLRKNFLTNEAKSSVSRPDDRLTDLALEHDLRHRLRLWLDAADTNSIILDSGAVSEWRDKSGNDVNYFQTTPGNRPTLFTEYAATVDTDHA
jgi:hypothetical protein